MDAHDINLGYLDDVVAKLKEYFSDLKHDQLVRLENTLTELVDMVEDKIAADADASNEEVDTNSEV